MVIKTVYETVRVFQTNNNNNERCAGGPKSKDFWPTVKPFPSNKGLLNDSVIILCENDTIVSEQAAVSGILNKFYVNVARDIGNGPDAIETHTSIHAIRAKFQNITPFDFNQITNERVKTFIGKSSSKKATGVDGISAKIIKSCKDTISEPLSTLMNFSIANSKFPNRLKEAQVIPVYKKTDPLANTIIGRSASSPTYLGFLKKLSTPNCVFILRQCLTHSWELSGQEWAANQLC